MSLRTALNWLQRRFTQALDEVAMKQFLFLNSASWELPPSSGEHSLVPLKDVSIFWLTQLNYLSKRSTQVLELRLMSPHESNLNHVSSWLNHPGWEAEDMDGLKSVRATVWARTSWIPLKPQVLETELGRENGCGRSSQHFIISWWKYLSVWLKFFMFLI